MTISTPLQPETNHLGTEETTTTTTTEDPNNSNTNNNTTTTASAAMATSTTNETGPLLVSPDDSFSDGMVLVMEAGETQAQAQTQAQQPPMENISNNEESTTMNSFEPETRKQDKDDNKPPKGQSDETADIPAATSFSDRFCKVQEMGHQDPPHYHLLPLQDFIPNQNMQEASLEKLQNAVQTTLSWKQNLEDQDQSTTDKVEASLLSYMDAAGDWIALTSDEGLRRALNNTITEGKNDFKIRVRSFANDNVSQSSSFDVELTAPWKNNLQTKFASHRLMEGDKEQYSKLVEIASDQFEVPPACLVFHVPQSGNRVQRIANNDDLVDACRQTLDGGVLAMTVERAFCTCIRISYPTIDKSETLSRRIPIQCILNKEQVVSYEKLLVLVGESLGTEEFVLTYFLPQNKTQVAQEDEVKNKFFITGINDLMDALRFFRDDQELVLVPQVPDQQPDDDELALSTKPSEGSMSAPIALVRSESSLKEKKTVSPLMLLTFQGRDDAVVEYPLSRIFVGKEKEQKASFWKLLGVVSEAFYLGTSPRICLFYVASDGTKAEIKSDTYLSEIIAGITSPFSRSSNEEEVPILRVRVEPIVFSVPSLNNGLLVRNFALSHILYNDGSSLSFRKLVRLTRMVDPVIGLTFITLSGATSVISKDADLVEALQQYPRGDLLIRPHTQKNPYVLDVKAATLVGQKCKLGSWSIPNIMFKTDSGLSIWDLSQLVPGKYRFSTRYWRDWNKGDVNLSIGVIASKDKKHVQHYLADARVRHKALSQVSLSATGLNESDFAQMTPLGDCWNVRSSVTAGTDTAFLVVGASPEWKESPEIFISDIECFYVGALED